MKLVLALVLVALGTGAVLMPTRSDAHSAVARLCPAIAGPRWTVLRGHQTLTGARYTIAVLNVGCSTATRSVKRFYVRRSPGAGRRLIGGPRGFVCRSRVPKGLRVYQGVCRRPASSGTAAAFSWAPKS